MVTKRSVSVIFTVFNRVRKCVVSLMYDGTSLDKSFIFSSTNSDSLYMIEPILFTMGLPGLSFLWIFGRV